MNSGGNVIILGAGERKKENLPAGLIPVDGENTLLEWLIDTYSLQEYSNFFYVSGFKGELFDLKSGVVSFRHNADWDSSGALGSLFTISKKDIDFDGPTFISYSDILYRKNVIHQMSNHSADVVLGIDRNWENRYAARTKRDKNIAEKVNFDDDFVLEVGKNLVGEKAKAEFIGVIKINPKVMKTCFELFDKNEISKSGNIPLLINKLIEVGVKVGYIDIVGQWSELNAPQDLSRFILGTKAESLERLGPLLKKGNIEDQITFTYAAWLENRKKCVELIQKKFGDTRLIVRSSSLSEDCWNSSSAGVHESLLNIQSKNDNDLTNSIEKVFDSYLNLKTHDQVLIQEMIDNVKMSGVIMTRTPSTGAPYYVLNFDEESKRTDSVTSGDGDKIRTVLILKDNKILERIPKKFESLINSVMEIEDLVQHDSLDIEFVITDFELPHIVQVRPIAINQEIELNDDLIRKSLGECEVLFDELCKPSPFLKGSGSCFSIMSDWNPAEIIGIKPNRLALSLYRYLVSDQSWATQRFEAGYRDVRPNNLIVSYLGHPYVDLRVCFNSFIPENIDDELAEKLSNFYLQKIKERPELHDKVEFEIIYSCADFDLNKQLLELKEHGFDDEELETLEASLVSITKKAITDNNSYLEKVDVFEKRFEKIKTSQINNLEKAYMLLEDTRLRGIIFFSHLARNAFIAMSFLKSLLKKGVISTSIYDDYLSSLETVTSMMNREAALARSGDLSWEEFLNKYGHLRPGTYDINSPCYSNMGESFLKSFSDSETNASVKKYSFDETVIKGINRELKKSGLDIDSELLLDFIKKAIEGREYAKFIFTKNLSAALECIASTSCDWGVTREEISCLTISEIFELRYCVERDVQKRLDFLIKKGKDDLDLTYCINLPNLIFSAGDFYFIEHSKASPNFVTQKKVIGSICVLSVQSLPDQILDDKIVVIPNADPGFDWIFSKKLKALVTMYGGSNSHMAIRAAEFQIPAIIGTGEVLYEKIIQAERLEIDCASKKINFLKV